MSEIQDKNHIDLEQFDKMDHKDGYKYELIDGLVYMSPRPNYGHQRVSGKIFRKLAEYFDNKPCEPFLEAELKIKNDIIIPDLSIICEKINSDITRYDKAPDLVIEILSPSSRYIDTFTKLYKYEVFRVKEYWIVNPEKRSIALYNFINQTNIEYYNDEILKSMVFEDLEINLEDIF
jgi:Uma2 family endonuclease